MKRNILLTPPRSHPQKYTLPSLTPSPNQKFNQFFKDLHLSCNNDIKELEHFRIKPKTARVSLKPVTPPKALTSRTIKASNSLHIKQYSFQNHNDVKIEDFGNQLLEENMVDQYID